MRYVIDRITDGKAVLEDENAEHIVIDASLLPQSAREGSVVIEKDGVYISDITEEKRRRRRLYLMLNKLRGRN